MTAGVAPVSLGEFARRTQAWFDENTPPQWIESVHDLDDQGFVQFQRGWLTLLNTQGFAAPGVPAEWGGGGYSLREQAAIHTAWARAGAPPVDLFEVSLTHVPGTFLTAGTEDQQRRYIRAALAGTVWCQGFSEPGAGSDLAALATTATRSGDGWRINGQKTWSSHAAEAEHCLLLARSEAGSTRQSGLTYFVLDLDQPGVTIRPIRQMHGAAEFCEIFLDDAYVPAENVIGAERDGWNVAQATLSAERGPMALPTIERLGVALRQLAADVAADSRHGSTTGIQQDIARLLARQVAVRSLALDTIDLLERGRDSGGLASLIKISFSDLLEEVTSLASLIGGEESLADPGSPHFLGYVSGRWTTDWLGSWAATIAGGANEIQRDIVAERLLAMPREPKLARGVDV